MTQLYRLFSGLMGGMIGTLFIIALYAVSVFFLGNEENPITNFILIFMIFIGSITANLSTGAFLSLADNDKYERKNNMLLQAFLLNLFLFLVAFPFYIFLENIAIVAVLQLAISAMVSHIIFEFFAAKGKYAISGLYGASFALFLLLVLLSLLPAESSISSLLLFSLLPAIWLILTLSTLAVEGLYTIYYQATGTRILDPQTKL